jgi:uncharacterized membrane protein
MEVFMEKEKKTFFSARNITFLAVLVALIVVLQVVTSLLPNLSGMACLVLVPIALGGMVLGVAGGAILGFVFGVVVIVCSLCGLNAFTFLLLNVSPVITVLVCLLKGTAAGVVSALLFKAISKKNKYVATFIAAAAVPVVNTGIFVIGAFIMSNDVATVLSMLGMEVEGFSIVYLVFVVCVGVNFFIEFGVSVVLSPALYTVYQVIEKQIIVKSKAKKVTSKTLGSDVLNDSEPT